MMYPVVVNPMPDALADRTAPRLQAIVYRAGRILMAKHCEGHQVYWCLPGGGLEGEETLEDGVLRELEEECHVHGRVVRPTGQLIDALGIETYTFLVDIGNQTPKLGRDPEVDGSAPILIDIQWLRLDEIPERDRAFLWQAGLMSVPGFLGLVESWGDEISFPAS
jgi:8-oxo-dGTP diphosphatase